MNALSDVVSPAWAIEALVASTVLMLVVLALRAPVRKAFGADVAYALWLLPVLRLLLPPLPEEWHEATVAPVVRATEQMTVMFVEPAAGTAAVAGPSFAWLVPAIAALWIVGAGAFVTWHWLAHRRFCHRMLDQADRRAEHGGVQVIETSAASGPLAFGIWRRYVAFPRDFAERFDADERDLALAHELGHHARGDLIANWIALVVLALHWFNPIAWRAFRAFRADQEIANDARVLAGLNPMRRHTYACAILKAAHGGAVSAACHLHTIDDLKGRLRMLTTNKTSRKRLIGGGATIALLTVSGLGLTASGSQAAERVRSGVQAATGVDIAALAPTAPPASDAAIVADAAPQAAPVGTGQVGHRSAPDVADVPEAPEAAERPERPEPAEAPEAPEAPPARSGSHHPGTTVSVTVDQDGQRIVRYGRYDRDATSTMVGQAPPVPPMPNMPRVPAVPPVPHVPVIVSRSCGTSKSGHRMVIDDRNKSTRTIILCEDRIAAAAARGVAIAANSKDMERNAYARALDGLRASRSRMMQEMSGEQRKAALEGIDTAIAELERDVAKTH